MRCIHINHGHAPGTGTIAQPVDLHSVQCPTLNGCPQFLITIESALINVRCQQQNPNHHVLRPSYANVAVEVIYEALDTVKKV